MILLRIRGVFLILIFLLSSVEVLQAQVSGTVDGFLSREEFRQEWRLDLDQSLGPIQFNMGWEGVIGTEEHSHAPHWRLFVPIDGWELDFSKNQPHFTSPDAFRLVHKNNFSQETFTATAVYGNMRMGLFQKIPSGNKGTVDAQLIQGRSNLGTVDLLGTVLTYGTVDRSFVQVWQGEYDHKPWKGLAVWGVHSTSGEQSYAFLTDTSFANQFVDISASMQYIEPGFTSLFAKTNKYASDRKGVHWKVNVPFKGMGLAVNRRVHSNISGTRNYNQFSVEIQSPTETSSVHWRLEPTQAFIVHFQEEHTHVQIDVVNQTIRLDWGTGELNYRLSSDISKALVRLETKFSLWADWRLIVKRDFINNRNYFSALVRKSTQSGYLQLEWGQYDRGNIYAGFDTLPQLGISWGYKF